MELKIILGFLLARETIKKQNTRPNSPNTRPPKSHQWDSKKLFEKNVKKCLTTAPRCDKVNSENLKGATKNDLQSTSLFYV